MPEIEFYEGLCRVTVQDKTGEKIKTYIINHGLKADRIRMREIVHGSLRRGLAVLSEPMPGSPAA